MNRRAKGRRNRTEGMKWLEKYYGNDFLGGYVVPESRYSKDAFGVADAFIILKNIGILPVQFKSNEWGPVGKYNEWAVSVGMHLIIVRKDDYRGFRIRVICPRNSQSCNPCKC